MKEVILDANTLILGDRSVLFPQVKDEILKKNGAENITFFEIEKLNISVDDIRLAISFVNKKSEEKKVVLLSSFFWNEEAQNALLKVLEETPADTLFILFGLHKKYFLPTIHSRIQSVNISNTNRFLKLANEVLKLEPNVRASNKNVTKILASKITDTNYIKNTESEKKDREQHILFLESLISVILENREKSSKSFLQKIEKIAEIADSEGGSPHLFIDWLLLSAPII